MLELTIPMPAISLNHSHISLRRGGRIKTKETRHYEEEFGWHLLKYGPEIAEFLKGFDPNTMGVCADYVFFFPKEQFFCQKKGSGKNKRMPIGRLNTSALPDTDNLIKLTQDLIFFHLMNDAYVIELTATKRPTTKNAFIKVTLESIPLPREEECEH